MHANVLLTGEVVERPQALSGQRRMKVKVSLTEDTQRGEQTSVFWHYVTFTDQQVTKTTKKRPNELHSTNRSQGPEFSRGWETHQEPHDHIADKLGNFICLRAEGQILLY